MKNKSSYGSSSNSKALDGVLCKHNLRAVYKTIKNGSNVGRNFYGCPLWPENDCRFFQLEDDYLFGKVSVSRGLESDDFEKTILKEKVKKLEDKKENLKKLVLELRNEVRKHSQGEKIVMTVLIVSWIFFAIYVCASRR